jgi:cell shape-determining protein MreC
MDGTSQLLEFVLERVKALEKENERLREIVKFYEASTSV